MPCRSDYLQQTGAEATFQSTAKLILWLFDKGVIILDPADRTKYEVQAKEYYAKDVGQVEHLCRIIKHLREYRPGFFEDTLKNNFKDPVARELMDWIDEHDEADRRREAAEATLARAEKEQIVAKAIAALDDTKLEQIIKILQN